MFKPNYLKSDQQIDVQAKWDGVTTIKREEEEEEEEEAVNYLKSDQQIDVQAKLP